MKKSFTYTDTKSRKIPRFLGKKEAACQAVLILKTFRLKLIPTRTETRTPNPKIRSALALPIFPIRDFCRSLPVLINVLLMLYCVLPDSDGQRYCSGLRFIYGSTCCGDFDLQFIGSLFQFLFDCDIPCFFVDFEELFELALRYAL